MIGEAVYEGTRVTLHRQAQGIGLLRLQNPPMGFMDFTINNIQDWNWGDLGSLLGHDGVPSAPPPHGPGPGPPPPGPH